MTTVQFNGKKIYVYMSSKISLPLMINIIRGFLIVLGSIEVKQWCEIGYSKHACFYINMYILTWQWITPKVFPIKISNISCIYFSFISNCFTNICFLTNRFSFRNLACRLWILIFQRKLNSVLVIYLSDNAWKR